MHASIAASINTKKICLHPTADFDVQPVVLMVVNIFHSSTKCSDCCCINIMNVEIGSRCPEVGRKRRPSTTATLGRRQRPPTTVHVRESDKVSVLNTKDTITQKKKTFGQGCGQNYRNSKRLKIDVENCRLIQFPLLCKAVSSVCIHHEASDFLNRSSVTLQVSRVQASESRP